jgi:hypothetical protein
MEMRENMGRKQKLLEDIAGFGFIGLVACFIAITGEKFGKYFENKPKEVIEMRQFEEYGIIYTNDNYHIRKIEIGDFNGDGKMDIKIIGPEYHNLKQIIFTNNLSFR